MIIHGTFVLGLPVETRETIEEPSASRRNSTSSASRSAWRRRIRARNSYEQARLNGWFSGKDKTDIVHDTGFQGSTL